MRIIELDATKWEKELDFNADLLRELGAPDWHGESVAALVDSMIYGRINTVEPPYVVRVLGANTLPKEIREHIEVVGDALDRARVQLRKWHKRDVDVNFEVLP